MMIICIELEDKTFFNIPWHYGEPFPNVNPEKVKGIHVDGDELEYLRRYYPVGDGKTYSSAGSDAQYIVEGLKAFTSK